MNRGREEIIGTVAPLPQWVCILLIVLFLIPFYYKGIDIKFDAFDFEIIWGGAFYPDNPLFLHIFSLPQLYSEDPSPSPLITRPVLNLCYFIAIKLVGLQQAHILLHILSRILLLVAALCAFYIMRRLTGNPLIGLYTALLFSGLFLNGDNIYFCHRLMEGLWTVFGLLSILFYMQYSDDGRPIYYFLSLMSFSLALGSKETALILPALILLLDLYVRREIETPWGKAILCGIKRALPFLVVSLVWLMILEAFESSQRGSVTASATMHNPQEIIRRIVSTPAHIFIPAPINSYSIRFLVACSVVCSLVVVYIGSDKKIRHFMLFLTGCTLILTIPIVLYFLGTRYFYFSSVFSMALFACAVDYFAKHFGHKVVESSRPLAYIFSILYIFVLFNDALMQTGFIHHLLGLNKVVKTLCYPIIAYLTQYRVLESILFFSLIAVYICADKEVKRHMLFLAGGTLVLMSPVFFAYHFRFAERYIYLPATFSIVLIAQFINVRKLLDNKITNVKNLFGNADRHVYICMYICIYVIICIRAIDYRTIHRDHQLNEIINNHQNWMSQELKTFLVTKDNKDDIYLLNFPKIYNLSGAFVSFTPFIEISSAKSKLLPMIRRWVEYYCDIDNWSGEFPRLHTIKIDHPGLPPVQLCGTDISVDSFNTLTKAPDNRILLFDYGKEQIPNWTLYDCDYRKQRIVDVTGMDYYRVRELLSTGPGH